MKTFEEISGQRQYGQTKRLLLFLCLLAPVALILAMAVETAWAQVPPRGYTTMRLNPLTQAPVSEVERLRQEIQLTFQRRLLKPKGLSAQQRIDVGPTVVPSTQPYGIDAQRRIQLGVEPAPPPAKPTGVESEIRIPLSDEPVQPTRPSVKKKGNSSSIPGPRISPFAKGAVH